MSDSDPTPGGPPASEPPGRQKITDRTVNEVMERTRDVIRKTREMLESSRELLDRVRHRDEAAPQNAPQDAPADDGGDGDGRK